MSGTITQPAHPGHAQLPSPPTPHYAHPPPHVVPDPPRQMEDFLRFRDARYQSDVSHQPHGYAGSPSGGARNRHRAAPEAPPEDLAKVTGGRCVYATRRPGETIVP